MSTLCDHCGQPIAGTSDDPIHCTSLGIHHGACMHAAHAARRAATEAHREAGRARRSASARAAHARKTTP